MQQSIPATIGMIVMSIYMVVDTIFVGRWVGNMAIAAITVVMPVTFLISSIGMAIGIGGASIISRALGRGDHEYGQHTFGNQITLTLSLSVFFVILGLVFEDQVLHLFGAQGDILPYADSYYRIIMYGVPFLGMAMMTNNVIRAQGEARIAMYVLLIPAVLNIILDPIFIKVFDWGLDGAAWATTISYGISALYAFRFFYTDKSEIKVHPKYFKLEAPIAKEIGSLGGVSLARQGSVSILYIVLNQALLKFGGEIYIAAFGIINRVMMIAYSPVIGMTQGFMPIAGFNYGAKKQDRVHEVIRKSLTWGTLIAISITALVMIFARPLIKLFMQPGEHEILDITLWPWRVMFFATPVIFFQMISSAYFQAIGKALPALLLTLTKQVIFLIPLILILPHWLELNGVWYSFPIADISSAIFCFTYMYVSLKKGGLKRHVDYPPDA